MQEIGGCANFAVQLLHGTFNLFSLLRKRRRSTFRMTNKLSDILELKSLRQVLEWLLALS